MLFLVKTAFFLSTLPYLAAAYPALDPSTDVAAAGKAHNIYLATCIPRSKNDANPGPPQGSPPGSTPSPTPGATANFTVVAYFRQPLNVTSVDPDTKAPKPDKAALVSQPPEPWEGVKWKVKVWNDKLFSASIAADAAASSKGSLAGDAKLAEEQYICFRDGETAIKVREDAARGNCVADYWCAGLDAKRR